MNECRWYYRNSAGGWGHNWGRWYSISAQAHRLRTMSDDSTPLVGMLVGQYRECQRCARVEFAGQLHHGRRRLE